MKYILYFLLISNLTFAQSGQLKGTVSNGDGKPAEFVSIKLKEISKGTTTNEKGEFIINNIKADTYILVASFVGFKTLERKIKIETDKTLSLSLELFENSELLKEIVVKGDINPNEKMLSLGKMPIKAMDLPQSIAVISQETMVQQQVLRLSDAIKNANGVYVSGNSNASGNNQEEFGARGFVFGSGNTFKNGVRFNGTLIPEASSLTNIEILKGSSALLFGNVGAGGILNLVTKKPKFTQGGEVTLKLSEYNFIKPTIDVYGSVNKSSKIAYRVVSTYEKANSFRDNVNSERFYINPSVLLLMNKKNSILLEGDYLKDNRTPDFGLTTINYDVIKLPRNSFLGFDWGNFNTIQESFTTTFNQRFNEKWQLKSIISYQGFTTNLLSSLRPNSTNLVQPNGDWVRGVQKMDTKQKYGLGQIDLNGEFNTGNIKHTILIGVDTDVSNTKTLAFNNITNYDKINIYEPTKVLSKNEIYASTVVPLMSENTNQEAIIKRAGIYVQDFVEFSTKLKLLTGLRYSYLENITNTYTYATKKNVETKSSDNAFSPKIGLTYQPTVQNAMFLSYTNSFALNTGTDINLKSLPTSTIHQYEIGIKNEFFNKRLTANVTSYIIDYSNLAQTDLSNGNTNTNIKELAGSYQSKGVEVDVVGHLKNLKIMAGYSFNDAKYTKSNIYAVSTKLRFVPNHTANASAFYTFENTKILKGLELGILTTYIGKRFGGRLSPLNPVTTAEKARRLIPVEGFLQTDISVGYTFKAMSIRAKLANIGNVISYYVYDDNTVTPIAPRMATTTVSFKF
jgi:iron complex outermembrane recepter protein